MPRFGWIVAVAACLAAGSAPAVGFEDSFRPEPAKKSRQPHWWERVRAARPTPAEQLAFANELAASGSRRKAARAWRALVYKWPNAAEAPVAQYNYARYLEQRKSYRKAFDEYQYLIDAYSGFYPYNEVLARQYEIADAVARRVRRFLGIPYRSPEDAIPLFEQLVRNGWGWELAPELQFRIGQLYEESGDDEAAADAYSALLQHHPRHQLAPEAAFAEAACLYRVAKKYPSAVDLQERAGAALQSFLVLHSAAPGAPQARFYLQDLQNRQAELFYRQAKLYEKSVGRARRPEERVVRLTAAQMTYRRLIETFPESALSEPARIRMRLIEKQIGALNERL